MKLNDTVAMMNSADFIYMRQYQRILECRAEIEGVIM